MNATFDETLKQIIIYVFSIKDEAHKDCLKIGETTLSIPGDDVFPEPNSDILNEAARKRINKYTQTAGIAYTLLYTESTLFKQPDGTPDGFRDTDVHKVLQRSGVEKKKFEGVEGANEWYICTLDTVINAIKAIREGRQSLSSQEIATGSAPTPIQLRPNQREAIALAVAHFQKAQEAKKRKEKDFSRKMLWNAKMRFGKTIAALQVAKEMAFRKTLIITHRPVVKESWFEDFAKIFSDCPLYLYGSKTKGESLSSLEQLASEKDISYVYFASIQDLRGSEAVGGNYDKNADIYTTKWDFLIIDEAHEGTQTEQGQKVIYELRRKKPYELHLSGTPFNLIYKYEDDEVYTWDYIDEQLAKEEWDKKMPGTPNPYASLPSLSIYTYDLGTLLTDSYFDFSNQSFSFREFFRTDEAGDFVYDEDIDAFLNLLCQKDANSLYPYSNEHFRTLFRHTLWMVPGVKAAHALCNKLRNHDVFGQFTIVNVAGSGDEDGERGDALQLVEHAIKADSEATRTITVSCGRLTTGVTVPPWTGVFLLSGSYDTSASWYMQTVFRVQSPHSVRGRMKTDCYAFDFAPDRTLRIATEMVKVSAKPGEQTDDDRAKLGQLLNFCPIIAYSGSGMQRYDVPRLLTQLKRIQIERVVQCGFEDENLYNDELLKLTDNELAQFANLKAIIGTTDPSVKKEKIEVNQQGFTKEEYDKYNTEKPKPKHQLTPEETAWRERMSEVRKQRQAAISILRGISVRMPLMLYGAEINDEDKELTIDNFVTLVDDDSWTEFMPKGVTKDIFTQFQKYYDADIFYGAGKRIREKVRRADLLPVEQRIERLTALFATFRNPDKETVLTPWRVVNMHLAESIGGYSFFDAAYTHEERIPELKVIDGITNELFRPQSVVLEINAKTGLYPLYACYTFYRKRLEASHEDFTRITQQDALKHWDQSLRENILVLCKTPMACSIARRTLAGFRDTQVRAHYFPNLLPTLLKTPWSVKNILKMPSVWGINKKTPMKIDAVIGNPPYQVSTDNSRSNPVYHQFIDLAAALSPRVTLITPARYLFRAGFTPNDWNEKVLADPHFKIVWYRANSTEVFPMVDIKGGVAVMYRDSNANFGAIEVFTAYPELDGIAHKVSKMRKKDLTEIIYAESSYRFDTAKPEVTSLVKERLNNDKKVISNVFDKLPDLFTASKKGDLFTESKEDEDIGFVGRQNGERCIRYISRKYIEDHPNLEKYKVLVPESNGTGAIGEVLSTPLIGEPLIGVTQTFISIGAFDTRAEAEACLKYVKTRFARTLLGILKATQHNPKDTWRLIPLQDFTAASDIDWSQSVADIDRALFAKYALSAEEIAFMEAKIRPMF